MNDIELEKLKTAINQINNGVDLEVAQANVQYVNYNELLLKKINILKQIPLLNNDVLKYLYSIKLTDRVDDVANKVNSIFDLAVRAKLIEDIDQIEKKEKEQEEFKIKPNENETDIAMKVVNKIIGG